ncbi:MAG: DUF1289 domain-containing protein [Sedimenticola sp.]
MQFNPCRGHDHCTEDGTHCQGCGRSHQEVAQTRALIGSVAKYALDMGYENIKEFTTFIGDKAAKKAAFAQMQEAAGEDSGTSP